MEAALISSFSTIYYSTILLFSSFSTSFGVRSFFSYPFLMLPLLGLGMIVSSISFVSLHHQFQYSQFLTMGKFIATHISATRRTSTTSIKTATIAEPPQRNAARKVKASEKRRGKATKRPPHICHHTDNLQKVTNIVIRKSQEKG